jgi:murein DD-endopeptidase MepM/ murein hydrolase activator NlpD
MVNTFWGLLRSSFIAGVLLFFVGLPHIQATVSVGWRGFRWISMYGSGGVVVASEPDHLITFTGDASVNYFGGGRHLTSSEFQAAPGVWMEATFQDTGASPGPWVTVWTITPQRLFHAALGAQGDDDRYLVYWRREEPPGILVEGSPFVAIAPRTPGEHTVKIAKRANGVLEFWLDGALVYSLTPDRFPMPTFTDVALLASGTAPYQFATYTNYREGTEDQRVSFNQTPTGFFWPIGTGTPFRETCGTWLGRDREHGGCYFDGLYHIGFDMLYGLDNPVYAISPGVVVYRSPNGWGTGNIGLFIKHTLDDGSEFLALYGHIRTNLQRGDHVSGGVEIGRVGPWPNGDHLHFGILPPGTDIPESYLGTMPNELWPDPNGFVDPVNWITTGAPKCTNGSSEAYYPSGDVPVHPNGALIQRSGNPGVYVLQDGQKRQISSPQRLWELYGPGRGFDFGDVVFVSQGEFDQYPTGPDVIDAIPYSGRCEPPGRLVQQRGQGEISMVTGDCVRRVFSGEPFLRLGYSFCNAAQVDDYYTAYQRETPDITR